MRVPRFRAPKYLLFYLWTTRNGGHFGDGFRRPPLPEWERDEEGGNCAPVGAEIRCDTGGSSRPAGPGGPRRTFELAAGAQKQYCRDWVRLCRAATGRSSKERGRAAIGRRETRQGETGSAPRANAKQLANGDPRSGEGSRGGDRRLGNVSPGRAERFQSSPGGSRGRWVCTTRWKGRASACGRACASGCRGRIGRGRSGKIKLGPAAVRRDLSDVHLGGA